MSDMIKQLHDVIGTNVLQYGVNTVISEVAYRATIKPYVESTLDHYLPSPYKPAMTFTANAKPTQARFWQNGAQEVAAFAVSEISEMAMSHVLPNMGGIEKIVANGTAQVIGTFASRVVEYPLTAFSAKP